MEDENSDDGMDIIFTSSERNQDAIQGVLSVTQNLDTLAQPNKATTLKLLEFLKASFVHGKHCESPDAPTPLGELLTEGFNDDQIWEEIQLQNSPWIDYFQGQCIRFTKRDTLDLLIAGKDDNYNKREQEGDYSDEEEDEDLSEDTEEQTSDRNNNEESEGEDLDDNDKQGMEHQSTRTRKRPKRSIVDDEFFNLSDMTKFLEAEDAAFERARDNTKPRTENDDDIDMFAPEAAEGDKNLEYKDFFDPLDNGSAPTRLLPRDENEDEDMMDDEGAAEMNVEKEEHENVEDEEEEEEDRPTLSLFDDESKTDEAGPSAHMKHEEKMKRQIEQLEEFNIAEKPWQLKGEVDSAGRPLNSLLAEDLDFEHTSRPAPVVTQESTMELEDIIKKRITDQLWDDVERKDAGLDANFKPRPLRELDQEKSKESLAQIYEQEFMKAGIGGSSQTAAEEALLAKHQEIENMLGLLDQKLNALTNFHYTPKLAEEEVTVVTNTPTIQMEEIIPGAGATDSQLFAPEEIHKKSKGVDLAATEKTETDRKRERRSKKKSKHVKRVEKEQKERAKDKQNPGRVASKKEAMKHMQQKLKSGAMKNTKLIDGSGKSSLSSTSFFQQLQEKSQ